jgi:Undecaprenyl-phosphate glucose phosphotransferase
MTQQERLRIEAATVADTGSDGGSAPIRFTSNIFGTVLIVTDVLCFVVSVPLAVAAFAFLRRSTLVPSVHLFGLALMLGSFLLIRLSRRSYERTLLDRSEDNSLLLFDAVLSSLIASALVWQAGLIDNFSRAIALLFLAAVALSLLASRPIAIRLAARLADRGRIQQRIVFYGADAESVATIARVLDFVDMPHLRVVGVVDDRGRGVCDGPVPYIGTLGELCDLARSGTVDQVFISGARFDRSRLMDIVDKLSSVSVDVSVIPAEAIELAPDYKVNLLGELPALTLWQRPMRDLNRGVKRLEDLVIASCALVLLSPLLVLTAMLVRLTSKGPVVFVQPRLGFNNEVIRVFKFRTMFADQTDIEGRATTTRGDPRITPVGKVLRRLSLDELPQLFNVIEGSMSLVGPRPHAIEMKVEDRYYHEAVRGYAGRHRVRPGITGYAQVKGLRGEIRTTERAKKRVELDQHYIDNWSLWLDLWILVLTARAVLFDSDAY